MDALLRDQIKSTFLSMTGDDEVGQIVMRGEACDSFVSGIQHGWDLIESPAVDEGLV